MDLAPIRNALRSADAREENSNKHTRYEKGQMLIHAKSLCAHGEWYGFLDEVGIEKSEANELMKWASYWQIAEISEVYQLKPSGTNTPQEQIAEISEVSLPTAHAQREFLRAEPEVKEVIIEKMIADPDAEIKAAEIKRLRASLTKVTGERDDAVRHINALEIDKVQTIVNDLGLRTSINGLLGDLGSGLADEYLQKVDRSTKETLLKRMDELSKLLSCVVERNQLTRIPTDFIDV